MRRQNGECKQCNTGYKFEHNGQLYLYVRYSMKKAVLMSDAVRLEQHKRIKRRTPEKHRKYLTHLKRCTDKLCHGGYSSSLDFITMLMSIYKVLPRLCPITLHNPTRTLTTYTTFVGVQRAKIVIVPCGRCGHSRFCQTCADC